MFRSCFNGEYHNIAGLSMAKDPSRPLHYQWDLANPMAKGTCVNFHAFFVGKGIANVLLNVIIFILVRAVARYSISLLSQAAYPSSLASAGYPPTASHSDLHLHRGWLVSRISKR